MMISVHSLLLFLSLFVLCFTLKDDYLSEEAGDCIGTYQELRSLLRSNLTDNVKRMLDVFYPPNKSPSHIVFVTYCTKRNAASIDELNDECNATTTDKFQFQWITNTIPLLIDSDVFKANTFNLAFLVQMNLTLLINQPFCDNTDGLLMLETLTVWLKSYAQGDEDTIKNYCIVLSDMEGDMDEGYLRLFDINGTDISFDESRLIVSAKKFAIGLWLGTTSITFALILHIGRVSAKTANALNSVLWELTEIVDNFLGLPQKAVSFMHKGVQETSEEDAIKTHGKDIVLNPNAPFCYAKQPVNFNVEEGIEIATGSGKLPAEQVGMILCANEEEIVVIKNKGADIPLPNSHVTFRSAEASIHRNTKIPSTNENDERNTKLRHAFNHFAESIQKLSTVSIIAIIGLLFYDIYIYMTKARRLSYDWLILFPIPFWGSVVTIINLVTFLLTEIVLLCRCKEERGLTKRTMFFRFVSDLFVTMSATTAPLFVFFHLFWLFLALSAFSIRLLSSATFYIPLAIFGLWLLSVVSGMFKQWKKLLTMKRRGGERKLIKVLSYIGLFLYSLVPVCFLPFWLLLLATLHFFSDFLLEVVNLEEHSFLVVIGVIAVITATTRKISKHCQPRIDDD